MVAVIVVAVVVVVVLSQEQVEHLVGGWQAINTMTRLYLTSEILKRDERKVNNNTLILSVIT